MIVAFTLLGTISTSIIFPFLSYAINWTSFKVISPTLGFAILLISTKALTVATSSNLYWAPFIITSCLSSSTLDIDNLLLSLSWLIISAVKVLLSDILGYITTVATEGSIL